jgi:hypothetical protein
MHDADTLPPLSNGDLEPASPNRTPAKSPTRFLGPFILGISAVMFSVVFVPRWLADQRREEIARDGVPATAQVLEVTPTGNRFNGDPEVTMRLQVRPEGGFPYETSMTWTPSIAELVNYPRGAELDVRVDPEHEEVAILGARPPVGRTPEEHLLP